MILAYGGFKSHRHTIAPHIDCAEAFHVIFLINTLQKNAQIYKPGIILEFSGDGDAVCYVNNIKLKDIKTYLRELSSAHKLDFFVI